MCSCKITLIKPHKMKVLMIDKIQVSVDEVSTIQKGFPELSLGFCM